MMVITLSKSWPIFTTLIMRDLYVLRSRLLNKSIDAAIQLTIQTLSFGFLFPLLGMPSELIAPLYIGMSFVMYLFFNGYAFATTIMHLIANDKTTLLTYELTLPISQELLLVRYIMSYMIEALIVSIPLMTLGMWILADIFVHAQGSLITFFLFYVICLLFSGIFFMMLPVHYSPPYFWNNIWPRRLSWLLNFGAVWYTWQAAYKLNAYIAVALLANPFTYITEGLRSLLLGTERYIHASVCIGMISAFSICCWIFLTKAIHKRLDLI